MVVITLANAIQAITGFAGTVLAMPPCAYLLGLSDAKVVLNCMGLFSCVAIAWLGRGHIQWRIALKIWAVMLPCMVVGVGICQYVPSEAVLLQVYGCIIIGVGLKNLLGSKESNLNAAGQYAVLVGAGVIHGMFISGGALLVIYAAAVLKDKDAFRATIASVWVVLNTALLVTQVGNGLLTHYNMTLIAWGIVPLIVATYVGTKLAQKINRATFLKMVYVLLCISGVSLLL